MKPLMFILSAVVLIVLLGGCQTPEEQEQQTNQRRYDAIIKKNQQMIDRNQQKMPNRQTRETRISLLGAITFIFLCPWKFVQSVSKKCVENLRRLRNLR